MGLGHLMSFLKMFPSPPLEAWNVPSLPRPGGGHVGIQAFLPLHVRSRPDGPQDHLIVTGLLQVPVARLKSQQVSLWCRYHTLLGLGVCFLTWQPDWATRMMVTC